jgi:ubiquinone/menaquinone biosynthesis C-methylase UbiE
MNQAQNLTPAEMFDQYFGPALFIPWSRMLLEYAAPQPGERVLDLACGTGTVARQVAPLVGPHGKVVGLDINPAMLTVARNHPAPSANLEWLEGDATALDLQDESFDLLLCQQGLQYFPNRSAAVREMRRVLAKGGRVALNLWQTLEQHPVYKAIFEAQERLLGVPLTKLALPFSLSDARELYSLLDEAGFERIDITPKMLEVHFPSPERFVQLLLFALTAFLPEFDSKDATLLEALSREVEPVVKQYRKGDTLTFPTRWNFALAYT